MRQHHHHDVTDTFAHSAKSPAKHQTSGIKVSSRTKFKLKFTMTSMEVLFDNEKNFKNSLTTLATCCNCGREINVIG